MARTADEPRGGWLHDLFPDDARRTGAQELGGGDHGGREVEQLGDFQDARGDGSGDEDAAHVPFDTPQFPIRSTPTREDDA